VGRPAPQREITPARADAALGLLVASGPAFRRTAMRISLCRDDADDAYGRAIEILLTRAPPLEPGRLAAWMQVVTRREALSLRRARERLLGARPADGEEPGLHLPCARPGPHELAELRELLASAAQALGELKPQERRALLLQAQGYSYAEIRGLTGWTHTKVNRCLSEGRARLRAVASPDRRGSSSP
jgi:RNA polymerase sigma factor (sigma-70 family)